MTLALGHFGLLSRDLRNAAKIPNEEPRIALGTINQANIFTIIYWSILSSSAKVGKTYR
jgi:hypothetical protein